MHLNEKKESFNCKVLKNILQGKEYFTNSFMVKKEVTRYQTLAKRTSHVELA